MSTTPSSTPSRHSLSPQAQQVRQAIEAQIGTLTCQVLELQVQLQHAYDEIGRLGAELAEANTFRAKVDDATREAEAGRSEA